MFLEIKAHIVGDSPKREKEITHCRRFVVGNRGKSVVALNINEICSLCCGNKIKHFPIIK